MIEQDFRYRRPSSGPGIENTIHVAGGGVLHIGKGVFLNFQARRDGKVYKDVPVECFPGMSETEDPVGNGLPDLLIGAPWLTENHVLMLHDRFDIKVPEGYSIWEPEGDTRQGSDFVGFGGRRARDVWVYIGSQSRKPEWAPAKRRGPARN